MVKGMEEAINDDIRTESDRGKISLDQGLEDRIEGTRFFA